MADDVKNKLVTLEDLKVGLDGYKMDPSLLTATWDNVEGKPFETLGDSLDTTMGILNAKWDGLLNKPFDSVGTGLRVYSRKLHGSKFCLLKTYTIKYEPVGYSALDSGECFDVQEITETFSSDNNATHEIDITSDNQYLTTDVSEVRVAKSILPYVSVQDIQGTYESDIQLCCLCFNNCHNAITSGTGGSSTIASNYGRAYLSGMMPSLVAPKGSQTINQYTNLMYPFNGFIGISTSASGTAGKIPLQMIAKGSNASSNVGCNYVHIKLHLFQKENIFSTETIS